MINYTKYTHLIINLISMNIYQEFPFELLYVEFLIHRIQERLTKDPLN